MQVFHETAWGIKKNRARKAFGGKFAAWRALEHFTIDSARIYMRLSGEWNTATGN